MAVMRKTRSVKQLLDEFKSSEGALSVVFLVKQLKENMNKTTVYRILDRLEENGQLHSFTDSSGLMWYAKCESSCSEDNHHDVHPHFQCNDCGKVECLDVEINIPQVRNRRIDKTSVLLTGKCEACTASDKPL